MLRVMEEIQSIIKADKIILNYPDIKVKKNSVNLHYYHAENNDDKDACNLGDYLSKVVTEYILSKKGISIDKSLSKTKHLYAIGSIIQMGYQNTTVWGSGFAFEPGKMRGLPHRYPIRRLDVRCVRGPYTRRSLHRLGHACPPCYGDPAVLMPMIHKKEHAKKEREYLIIPHYSMEQKYIKEYGSDRVASMNTKDYRAVIDMICSSQKVISSSLHGIILAETYGVPAIYLEDRPSRFRYKYADWYSATGRKISVETNLRRAIMKVGDAVPNLSEMKTNLINSFPYDLWEIE